MNSTKEKAKEFVNKFKNDLFEQRHVTIYTEDAILIALIAVDEILNIDNVKPYILHKEIINYYTKVKNEIEKL